MSPYWLRREGTEPDHMARRTVAKLRRVMTNMKREPMKRDMAMMRLLSPTA